MFFNEYDVVRIIVGKYEKIKKNSIGTIVCVYDNPELAYEVEVVSKTGKTVAMGVYFPEELELVTRKR